MSNAVPDPIVNGVASGKLCIANIHTRNKVTCSKITYSVPFLVKQIENCSLRLERKLTKNPVYLTFNLAQDNAISSATLCLLAVVVVQSFLKITPCS